MTLAYLNPKLDMDEMKKTKVGVLLLPGDLSETWRDLPLGLTELATKELFVTTIVGEALAFEPDRWVFIAPSRWTEDRDPQFEAVRIQDIARALAFAADARWPAMAIDAGATHETDTPINVLTALIEGELRADAASEAALPAALAFYHADRTSEAVAVPITLLRFADPAVRQSHIDVTGPARVLAWGPHLALNRGLWRLRLRFRLDEQAAGASFRIEWGDLTSSTVLDAKCDRSGVYLAEVDHEWARTDACEARLVLNHAAFGGEFVLEEMLIGRVSAA